MMIVSNCLQAKMSPSTRKLETLFELFEDCTIHRLSKSARQVRLHLQYLAHCKAVGNSDYRLRSCL